MNYSFPRYLLAKQTVDDRALNKDVLAALESSLPKKSLSVIEVGAGIGTMLTRLLRWGILPDSVDYTLIDSSPENIAFAQTWLPQWAREHGCQVDQPSASSIRFSASQSAAPSAAPSAAIRFSASQSVAKSAAPSAAIRFSASQSVAKSAAPSASSIRFSA
ncbi:MAG: class I SAM-dependent methyltransferase, partial [Chloroflexota bacterium]